MGIMKEIGAIVVIIFVIVFGLSILNQIQNQTPKNSPAYNATVNAENGLLTFTFWLEPVHLVELAATVIGLFIIIIWYISKPR